MTLYPLSMEEIGPNKSHSVDALLYRGFLPAVHAEDINPTKFYRNYFQTYVERDVRRVLQVKDLQQFDTFMRLCAGRIGQLVNANSLANEVGVSVHTIQRWFSILEASFLVFRLPPYHANLGKRLVKAAKIYFTDVGLASYLLGLESEEQIQRDPLRGNLFENLVVMELVKIRCNQGLDPKLYFYRDAQGNEVDLLFQKGSAFNAIEIKSAQTYHPSFRKGINFFKRVDPEKFRHGYVIYTGDMVPQGEDYSVLNFRDAGQVL